MTAKMENYTMRVVRYYTNKRINQNYFSSQRWENDRGEKELRAQRVGLEHGKKLILLYILSPSSPQNTERLNWATIVTIIQQKQQLRQ